METPWLTMKSMKRKACVSQTMLVRLNVISSVEWTEVPRDIIAVAVHD